IRETKDTEVLILRAPQGKTRTMIDTATPSKSLWATQNGEEHIVNHPVSVLASIVQGTVNKDVIDETVIQGKYDIDFKIDAKDPNSVFDSVRKYGLVID